MLPARSGSTEFFAELYSPEQAWWLDRSYIALHSVSTIFGVLTIIIHIVLRRAQNSSSFFFCIMTTIAHISFLIGPMSGILLQTNEMLCTIQGTLLQYSNLSGACWFLWIALQLYLVVVWNQSYKTINKSLRFPFHVFAWGFPLILTVLQLGWPGMIYRINWCWVDPSIKFGLWEWVCFYGPVLGLLLLVTYFWCISIWKVSRFVTKFKTRAYLIQSMVGVFTISVSYGVQAAHRIYLINHPNYYGFQVVHIVAVGLLGTLCFFVFGITPHTIKALKGYWIRCRGEISPTGQVD